LRAFFKERRLVFFAKTTKAFFRKRIGGAPVRFAKTTGDDCEFVSDWVV
jgi:hypothetical protein